MYLRISKWVLLLCISICISLRVLESVFTDEKSLLVIGVLSARNNFAARKSIRKTWKNLLNESNYKFYFIVGNEGCPIHPVDRKSDLTCEPLQLPQDQDFNKPRWTPEGPTTSLVVADDSVTAFTFHVNFPIVVQGFRLWRGLLQMSPSFTINVKNARTGTLITSALFSNSTTTNSSWVEIESNPFLLPKSFDAELQLVAEHATFTDQISLSCSDHSSWFNFSGAIEFTTQYGLATGWSNFKNNGCSPLSVRLKLHDVESFLSGKSARSLEWDWQMKSLSKRLSDEAETQNDILLVDVLDVYRNIPEKLLSFYVWAHKNLNFSFLLKTDDDTFLNIRSIEKYLKSLDRASRKLSNSPELWWWGRIRHGLPVERHGKWQELVYAAPVYPPFLCGGGYVLNEHIVKFLAMNSRWLHRFQGEDTSLGIWLSGVHPETPKNATCQWVCGSECDKFSCSRGQLSPDDMLAVWHQFQETQYLC